MAKTVWTFTNKRKLDKSQFLSYVEKKVFKTIRQHSLLPKNKIFTLKKSNDINTKILEEILKKKFEVKYSSIPNTSTKNLSDESESIFKNIIKGNFKQKTKPSPLLGLMDQELELYASLKNIKGESRKKDKKIQSLFSKFQKKNQDLEINILKASNQLK